LWRNERVARLTNAYQACAASDEYGLMEIRHERILLVFQITGPQSGFSGLWRRQEKFSPAGKGPHLAVGDGALEHPEAAVGVDPANPVVTERLGRPFDPP